MKLKGEVGWEGQKVYKQVYNKAYKQKVYKQDL